MLKCPSCSVTIDEKDMQMQLGLSAITKIPDDKNKIQLRFKQRPDVEILCKKCKVVMTPLLIML